MRRLALTCLLAYATATLLSASPSDFPETEISNGTIRAKLYLPDAERGSYRGTRFDWAGIITSLQYNGHEFFGQWYARHDPKIHDAITGPVEEFGADDGGLGYRDAKAGGTFVRIGVGVLRKPDEKAYRRFETYEIVDAGKRATKTGPNWIEFIHEVSAPGGYAYEYHKLVRLENGKPRLTLEHSLKNKGDKPIDTLVYDHNFFVIDQEVVGPDISIGFHFVPKPDKPLTNGGEIRDSQIQYTHELQPRETVSAELSGFGASAADNQFRISNRKSGASVDITGDQPVAKLVFWSIRSVACPEPYIRVTAAPGHEMKWKITYDFSANAAK